MSRKLFLGYVLSFLLLFCVTFLCSTLSEAACGVGVCGDGMLDSGEECDDGNLIPGDGCDSDCNESFDMELGSTLLTGNGVRALLEADYNQDGYLDLATLSRFDQLLRIYLRDSDGNYNLHSSYSLTSNTVYMHQGFINSDNYEDIVIANNYDTSASVLFGNGDGTFSTVPDLPAGNRPRAVKAVDLDGDCYDDIVIVNSISNDFTIYYSNGDNTFSNATTLDVAGFAMGIVIADFDRDDDVDLALTGDDGLSTFLRDGSTYGLEQYFNSIYSSDGIYADFNSDGYPDLAVSHYTGDPRQNKVAVFINNDDGTFQDPIIIDSPNNAWGQYVQFADLNNDGYNDLFQTGEASGSIQVYLGDGGAAFPDIYQYYNGSNVRGILETDVDKDGIPDILIADYGSDDVVPLYNNNFYQWPVCGDGLIGRGESCDDGNTADDDGCSFACQRERSASPVCDTVIVPDGNWRVRVTLLGASASLSSDVYLTSPQEELLIRKSLKNVGKIVTSEILEGDELEFKIHVNARKWGLGEYDHYAPGDFAEIYQLSGLTYLIGFEDMPADQADYDFNDVVLLVEIIQENEATANITNFLSEPIATRVALPDDNVLLQVQSDHIDINVDFPGGNIDEESRISLTGGKDGNYGDSGIGFFKVELYNGQTSLINNTEIEVEYEDADQDGVVDGTSIMEDDITIYHFDDVNGVWITHNTIVDKELNIARTVTDHFSLFVLNGALAPPVVDNENTTDNTTSSSSSSSSASCMMVEGGSIVSVLQMLLFLAPVLGMRLFRKRG